MHSCHACACATELACTAAWREQVKKKKIKREIKILQNLRGAWVGVYHVCTRVRRVLHVAMHRGCWPQAACAREPQPGAHPSQHHPCCMRMARHCAGPHSPPSRVAAQPWVLVSGALHIPYVPITAHLVAGSSRSGARQGGRGEEV